MLQEMLKRVKKNESGFTLVELLIVVAIIAILAAIAIPQFGAYRERGVRASMVADAKNTVTQLAAVASDESSYIDANGISITGTQTTITGTNNSQTYTFSSSKNNTVAITSTATAYTVSVTNAGAGTGKSPLTMLSTGSCLYADASTC